MHYVLTRTSRRIRLASITVARLPKAGRGLDWTLDGVPGCGWPKLANTLSYLIGDRFVVDKTGYAGTFDVHLRWTPGSGETGATWGVASPDDVGVSVFRVVQEQLGLRLKTGKGPVEVLVVDRAERPSEN